MLPIPGSLYVHCISYGVKVIWIHARLDIAEVIEDQPLRDIAAQ